MILTSKIFIYLLNSPSIINTSLDKLLQNMEKSNFNKDMCFSIISESILAINILTIIKLLSRLLGLYFRQN